MQYDTFVERLITLAGDVPTQAAVHGLDRLSAKSVAARVLRLVDAVAEVTERKWARRNIEAAADRTLVRLPEGGQAVGYHASGAVTLRTGLAPMDALFPQPEQVDSLSPRVVQMFERLGLAHWARVGEHLALERVWRIMAGASDGSTTVAPILCRAVGAFRHFCDGLPVWGPAAAAVSLAGGDALHMVTVHIRSTSGEVIDRVPVLKPEVAAREAMRQLSGLIRGGQQDFFELARPTGFVFGYFSLPKRKAQEVLAPVYVATVTTEGDEPMNHLVVVPGSDKEYVPIRRAGEAPPVMEPRRLRSR